MAKKTAPFREPRRLYTKLKRVRRRGDLIEITGRSGSVEHAGLVDRDYARDMVRRVAQVLAEMDGRAVFDDIDMEALPGGGLRFALKIGGEIAGAGDVTEALALKAKAFLDRTYDPPNLARIGRR